MRTRVRRGRLGKSVLFCLLLLSDLDGSLNMNLLRIGNFN